MNPFVRDILEFHMKFGVPISGSPAILDAALLRYRHGFLEEELREYHHAASTALSAHLSPQSFTHGDVVNVQLEKALDGLVDLTYVAIGTAVVFHGFNFEEAWNRVHAANMRKQRAEHAGQSTRNNALDVIKPLGWQAPNLRDLVIPT